MDVNTNEPSIWFRTFGKLTFWKKKLTFDQQPLIHFPTKSWFHNEKIEFEIRFFPFLSIQSWPVSTFSADLS